MTTFHRTTTAALLLLLWNPTAEAGVGPLRAGTGLGLLEDVTRYRVLPDRVEAHVSLKLKNEGKSGTFLLGLPAGDVLRTPQNLVVLQGESKRRLKVKQRKGTGRPDTSRWLAFRVKIAAGRTADLEISWWQPHGAVERYGYWRLATVDPLWTAGAFSGPVGRIERRVSFAPGVAYVSSSPEASGGDGEDWEHQDRTYVVKNSSPAPESKFSLLYRLTTGAFSSCSGDKPYKALDGNADTVWNPSGCPPDGPHLEIPTNCRGIGTHDPECNQRPSKSLVLGVAVRTSGKNDRQPVSIEGWWGPKRVWLKRGRINHPIPIMKKQPVTRLRIVFPHGLPASGIAEVNLVRLDLDRSPPGADALFTARGRSPRSGDNCQFDLVFTNPFSLRHITMTLAPRIPPRDWMMAADCAGNRGEEAYAEPVPHHKHSKKDLAKMTHPELFMDHGDDDHQQHGKDFKRKHPDRIELDTDSACMVKKLKLETIPFFCTGKRRNPRVPRIRLVY